MLDLNSDPYALYTGGDLYSRWIRQDQRVKKFTELKFNEGMNQCIRFSIREAYVEAKRSK